MNISIHHCTENFTDSAALLSQHENPVTLPTWVWLNQTSTHGQTFRNTRVLYKLGYTSVCHSPPSQAETTFHFGVNQMWSVVDQMSLTQNYNRVFISALAIILCTNGPYSFILIIIEVYVIGLSDDTVKLPSRTWHLTLLHIMSHLVRLCSILYNKWGYSITLYNHIFITHNGGNSIWIIENITSIILQSIPLIILIIFMHYSNYKILLT